MFDTEEKKWLERGPGNLRVNVKRDASDDTVRMGKYQIPELFCFHPMPTFSGPHNGQSTGARQLEAVPRDGSREGHREAAQDLRQEPGRGLAAALSHTGNVRMVVTC